MDAGHVDCVENKILLLNLYSIFLRSFLMFNSILNLILTMYLLDEYFDNLIKDVYLLLYKTIFKNILIYRYLIKNYLLLRRPRCIDVRLLQGFEELMVYIFNLRL